MRSHIKVTISFTEAEYQEMRKASALTPLGTVPELIRYRLELPYIPYGYKNAAEYTELEWYNHEHTKPTKEET